MCLILSSSVDKLMKIIYTNILLNTRYNMSKVKETLKMPTLKYVLLNAFGVAPIKKYEDSACYDLSYKGSPITLGRGEAITIGLNISFIIEKGYHVEIVSRSGLTSKHEIVVQNAPAIIDQNYTGEIMVIIKNQSPNTKYIINSLERIAQCKLVKTEDYVLQESTLEELEELRGAKTNIRKDRGLGSSDLRSSVKDMFKEQ